MNDLLHYGVPRRSGRYPWGSGQRPFQGDQNQLKKKRKAISSIGRDEPAQRLISKNTIDPDKPITIKKGGKIQHITGVDIKNLKSDQLYVTGNEYDNKLYEAFLSSMLKKKGWSAKKLELVAKEEIKAPSSNDQKEIFKNFYEGNKSKVLSDMADWMVQKGKAQNKESAIKQESSKSDKEIYLDFVNFLETKSDSRTGFYGILKQKGYNAVFDEHDRYSWIQAKYPFIVMNALESIGSMKITDLSDSQINKALSDWIEMNER